MTAPDRVIAYRVQAADGRGPWRPGWSRVWIDGDAPADRLTENLMHLMSPAQLAAVPDTMTIGCACRSMDALLRWFTPRECERLQSLGFYPVQLTADVVLAESPWQMVIGRTRPFTEGATRRRWCDGRRR